MTINEVYSLINTMPHTESILIEDINLRKEKYTKILKSGDNKQLVKLIRTLYLEKVEVKKLYVNDEKIMTDAEKLLHEEFALVLDIKVDEVLPFILGKLEVLQK